MRNTSGFGQFGNFADAAWARSASGVRRDDLRVGDAERKATVDRLVAAHGRGELDLSEFDERSAKAWDAKTVADLNVLTADLPGGRSPIGFGTTSDGSPRRRPSGFGAALRIALPILLAVMVVGMILNLAFHVLFWFWPVWIVLAIVVMSRRGRNRYAYGGPRW